MEIPNHSPANITVDMWEKYLAALDKFRNEFLEFKKNVEEKTKGQVFASSIVETSNNDILELKDKVRDMEKKLDELHSMIDSLSKTESSITKDDEDDMVSFLVSSKAVEEVEETSSNKKNKKKR